MIHLLKITALLFPLLSFTMTDQQTKPGCDVVSVTPRGQQIQIKHTGCAWIRIEYSTTDWRCRNGNCEKTGTLTWHDVKIDARGKEKIFYYRAAIGPTSVSEVSEASVLDCSCN